MNKVFWPDEGYTKGDLLDFYRRVGDLILPYLRDRPLVLVRYPDGIRGKSFFQKRPPSHVPEWMRTALVTGEGDEAEEVHAFIADDLDSLLHLVDLGAIPLHLWASRLSAIGRPDWTILDLDPKGAPFDDVVTIARAIHRLSEEIGLPAFVKTSGSSGLHVLVPLGAQVAYEPARRIAEVLAAIVVGELPEIATTARSLRARKGRVYVDCLQNGRGKLLVSPWSVRPLPGAPVSTPLRWNEVRRGLDPSRFTIATLPRRIARMTDDPFAGVLEESPDLVAVFERLLERTSG